MKLIIFSLWQFFLEGGGREFVLEKNNPSLSLSELDLDSVSRCKKEATKLTKKSGRHSIGDPARNQHQPKEKKAQPARSI